MPFKDVSGGKQSWPGLHSSIVSWGKKGTDVLFCDFTPDVLVLVYTNNNSRHCFISLVRD